MSNSPDKQSAQKDGIDEVASLALKWPIAMMGCELLTWLMREFPAVQPSAP